MLCRKPFVRGAIAYGCGQCLHCRINRSRQWMWRQYLESLCHAGSCFVTLTYDNEHLPKDGSLEPAVVQLWLKRFRYFLEPVRIRFFLVGEYGSESYRPHYHLSLFGVSAFDVHNGKPVADIIRESWGRGFVHLGEFNEVTAQYVSGYVVKGLRDRRDAKLVGLHPEFARMSRNPALGTDAMRVIANSYLRQESETGVLSQAQDVSGSLKLGSKTIPLGRTLLQKLRKEVFSEDYISSIREAKALEVSAGMHALFLANEEVPTFKKAYLASIEQALRNQEARSQIYRKKESL